jgi:hypothetical protein
MQKTVFERSCGLRGRLHDAPCSRFEGKIEQTTFRDACSVPGRKPICAVPMKAKCSCLPQAAAKETTSP